MGEREFESKTTGRFSRNGGNYRAVGQQLEVEFVPVKNFKTELQFGKFNADSSIHATYTALLKRATEEPFVLLVK